MTSENTVTPYSALAEIYDDVMSDVDYETWADYIDEIILTHHPEAIRLLELACGTGTVALSLEELDHYEITATDISDSMISVAKKKGIERSSSIQFRVMNFLKPDLKSLFDVIYMTFDSINYLHENEQILQLHRNVKDLMAPNGVFIYDFTTPKNSRKAIHYLNHENRTLTNGFQYTRSSSYNSRSRIHTNEFLIKKENKCNQADIYQEVHHQKIYTLNEITALVAKTNFSILKAYNSFTLDNATEKSLRVTMVLQ